MTEPIRDLCERCGYVCEKTSRADMFVDQANHNVAHDLVEALTASDGLRDHVAFILRQTDAPF